MYPDRDTTDVQGIIPMNDLAKLGATIKWDNTKCDIYIDDRKLPVALDNGCPTVDGNVGRDLMRRVEMMYKKRYALRVLGDQRGLVERTGRSGEQRNVEQVAKELCMEPEIEEYKELTSWFYWVPSELLERIPGERYPDPVQIPFNKRIRKRAEQATSLTVHLFAGMETKIWKATESENSMVLLVELEKGQDLHNNHLYGWLCRLAREGRITTLLAGPPCRTVSLARYRNDDGPKPVRARQGYQRFGLDANSVAQQYLCDGDTILWLRTMYLVILAYRGNPGVAIAVEQPADPESWKPPWHPRPPEGFASYLAWPETELAKEMASMKVINFDQGPLGHKYPKPTQLLVSNAPELEALEGIKAPVGQVQGWPTHLYDRLDESKAAAEWATGLRETMVGMIQRMKEKTRFVPREGSYHEGTLPPPAGWRAATVTYALADHRPGADLSARNRSHSSDVGVPLSSRACAISAGLRGLFRSSRKRQSKETHEVARGLLLEHGHCRSVQTRRRPGDETTTIHPGQLCHGACGRRGTIDRRTASSTEEEATSKDKGGISSGERR